MSKNEMSLQLNDFAIVNYNNYQKDKDVVKRPLEAFSMWLYKGNLYLGVKHVVKGNKELSKLETYYISKKDIVSFQKKFENMVNGVCSTDRHGVLSMNRKDKNGKDVSIKMSATFHENKNTGRSYFLLNIDINGLKMSSGLMPDDRSIEQELSFKSHMEYYNSRLVSMFIEKTDSTVNSYMARMVDIKDDGDSEESVPEENYNDYNDVGFN